VADWRVPLRADETKMATILSAPSATFWKCSVNWPGEGCEVLGRSFDWGRRA